MTHRERLETAWRFEEPDRVPIELAIAPGLHGDPRAERLVALIREHSDNFVGAPGPDFGFMGLPTDYTERVVEERPGQYKCIERVHRTPAGAFTALTYHPAEGGSDFHWKERFVATPDDLRRLAEAPREPASWDGEAYRRRAAEVGDAACPMVGLWHPLGTLVRNAKLEEVYAWFHQERGLMHRFLEVASGQVAASIERMGRDAGAGLTFVTYAHEMLIPPWFGHRLFDEFVRPYDQEVNAAIHRIGGRLRAHCHGRCLDFLEGFADMGINATEPLEPPPFGDVDLAEAKRRVGDRMLLSGNIASQRFVTATPAEVREEVRRAILAAAPGGGFTLRTTGGYAGTGTDMSDRVLRRVLANGEAYLLAGLKYGQYPIRAG